ncbi:MAG: hypothetical protein ACKOGL_03340, partial [Acidimicrobiaceae bacterium]
TGMVIDLDAQNVTVVGKGVVTIRVRGESTQIASGETFSIDRLRDPQSTATPAAKIKTENRPSESVSVGATQSPTVFDNNLRAATDRLNHVFAAAIANADAYGAARAALE